MDAGRLRIVLVDDRNVGSEGSGRGFHVTEDLVVGPQRAGRRDHHAGGTAVHHLARQVGDGGERRGRSEERRVGKECGSTCRSRGAPGDSKKNKGTTQSSVTSKRKTK